jgi:sarcosine oxidase, subunit gamma
MLNATLGPRAILRVQAWQIGAPPPLEAEQLLGLKWQSDVGGVAAGDADTHLLCTGPADWLLLASADGIDRWLPALIGAFPASSYRVTNVSSALTRWGLAGSRARTVLSKVCALDMRPVAFPAGRCARTRLADVPVVLHCRGTEVFEAIAAASHRDYLLAWLKDATLEFS